MEVAVDNVVLPASATTCDSGLDRRALVYDLGEGSDTIGSKLGVEVVRGCSR